MHVRVEPYSPAWAAKFKAEAARVARALGDALLEVHHIGSTSVPGLAAEPVIDMMPVVRDLASADARRESLEALGYEWCGEFGIPGRRYLRRSSARDPHLRLFQLHVFSQDSVDDIRRHLAVRDYLRTHADAARAYGALKGRLARRFPEDIDACCDGKDDFVQHLQHDAVAWMTGRVQSLPVIALRDRPDLIECAAEWFSSIWGVATEDYRASMRTRSTTSSWPGCGRRTRSRSANADASGTEGVDGYHGHVPDPALSKPALLRSGAADDHRAPRARTLARRGTCGQASRATSGMELSSMSFSRYVASRLSQNSGVVPNAFPSSHAISGVIARRPWMISETADWGRWMAFARRYWDIPSGLRNSSSRISPGVEIYGFVEVTELDLPCLVASPYEAEAPAVVHTDAIPTRPVSPEQLQAVARRDAEVPEIACGVEHLQLSVQGP